MRPFAAVPLVVHIAMRILVVSNIYPPHYVGGYELGCRDVVEVLQKRGHLVRVLTSDFTNASVAPTLSEPNVHRILKYNSSSRGLGHQVAEGRKLTKLCASFSPDLVYFWNLGGISMWLPLVARWNRRPFVFFLFDTNFISWRIGACFTQFSRWRVFFRHIFGWSFLIKGWPVLSGAPCHFGSNFLRENARENGIPFDEARSLVVKWGIDPKPYLEADSHREHWPVRHLLYVGQIVALKGIHTAIAALGNLVRNGYPDLHLTIVGGGMDTQYAEELTSLVRRLNLEERVEFRGKIDRTKLPLIYAEHDVLIFPSEWPEPFGITRLEAMATGLVVVGTTTGGSGELLRDGDTAFTFKAGDITDCARALREACQDRATLERIRHAGKETVVREYSLEEMGATLDTHLCNIARAAK